VKKSWVKRQDNASGHSLYTCIAIQFERYRLPPRGTGLNPEGKLFQNRLILVPDYLHSNRMKKRDLAIPLEV
jgi:hypothetical protein